MLRAPESDGERPQRSEERTLSLSTLCGTYQVIFSINHDPFTKFNSISEFDYSWNHTRASFEISPAQGCRLCNVIWGGSVNGKMAKIRYPALAPRIHQGFATAFSRRQRASVSMLMILKPNIQSCVGGLRSLRVKSRVQALTLASAWMITTSA